MERGASLSDTQDLLDTLQSLSSEGDISDTAILQKLSSSQIHLLTSHLEQVGVVAAGGVVARGGAVARGGGRTPGIGSTPTGGDRKRNLMETINDALGLPIQEFQDFGAETVKTDAIFTLGGM